MSTIRVDERVGSERNGSKMMGAATRRDGPREGAEPRRVGWKERRPGCRSTALLSSALLVAALLGPSCVAPPEVRERPIDPTGMPPSASESERAEARRLLGLALDDVVAQTIRVQRLGRAMRIAGRPWCEGRLSLAPGVAVFDADAVPEVLRALAEERFGPSEGLRVLEVFEGTSAARAGVEPGDVLLSVDGTAVSTSGQLVALPTKADGSQERAVRLRRGEAIVERTFRPEAACAFSVSVWRSLDRIAATDLRSIWISAGLMRIFDDARLALVIGHEMGHALVSRSERLRRPDRSIEAQADRLGLFLAARAGFEPVDTDVWEPALRDLDAYDRGGRRSHPTTYERTLALRETVAEIRDRLERGLPLDPTADPR